MALTAVVHSVFGEKRLIGPILALNGGILLVPLARQVLRFAWHLTSVLMLVSAVLVIWPGTPLGLIQITGAAWLAAGFLDAVYTQGKHIGWPFLSGAGICALLSTLS